MLQLVLVSIIVAVISVSCGSKERHITDLAYSVSVEDNPGKKITALENDIEEARKNSVDIFSPSWFESAQISLEQAKAIRDERGDLNALAREIAEGNAQLKRAVQFAEVSRKTIPDVVASRKEASEALQSAKESGTAYFGELRNEMQSANDQFTEVTRAVEDNNIDKVNSLREPLIRRYATLENKALKREKLDTARRIVDQAIQEGAKSLAPKALYAAEQTLRSADTFISSGASSEKLIEERSTDAIFYANRALQLTREAKQFSKKSPEETVLWIERVVTNLGSDLGIDEDHRNQGFEEQVDFLRNSAKQMKERDEMMARNPKEDDRG